jgi:hypothetical protein
VQGLEDQIFHINLQLDSAHSGYLGPVVEALVGTKVPLDQASCPSDSCGTVQTTAGDVLVLTGFSNQFKIFKASEIKSFQHQTVTVHNPHTNADETYSGVPLIELLKQVGAPVGRDLHGKALSEYVVATGSDGYKAVLALAEVEPDFHPGDVLVADSMDGKPLDAKTGPFRLVVTEDKRPARSVHNLVSLEVKTAE